MKDFLTTTQSAPPAISLGWFLIIVGLLVVLGWTTLRKYRDPAYVKTFRIMQIIQLTKYRKELAEGKEAAYKDAVESAAIDLAVENAEIVDLPEEMVHEEVHRSVNEFLGNMQRQGISPDMYFQITGTTQEDLHKQHEADAEARTKTNLVIEAIAKAEGFEASAEEIEAEISSLANDYNMEADRVRQLLSEDMLKHDITIKKAVEVITSTAKVK